MIQLYWTPALPEYYVGHDTDTGERRLVQAGPIAPIRWGDCRPYRGNYRLQRVIPTGIERFYQPTPPAA